MCSSDENDFYDVEVQMAIWQCDIGLQHSLLLNEGVRMGSAQSQVESRKCWRETRAQTRNL